MAEKIALAICLFGGFLWLRTRARRLHAENHPMRVVLGFFVLLPALLIGGKYLFDRLVLEPWIALPLKVAAISAAFAFVGFAFVPRVAGEKPPGEAEGPGS